MPVFNQIFKQQWLRSSVNGIRFPLIWIRSSSLIIWRPFRFLWNPSIQIGMNRFRQPYSSRTFQYRSLLILISYYKPTQTQQKHQTQIEQDYPRTMLEIIDRWCQVWNSLMGQWGQERNYPRCNILLFWFNFHLRHFLLHLFHLRHFISAIFIFAIFICTIFIPTIFIPTILNTVM